VQAEYDSGCITEKSSLLVRKKFSYRFTSAAKVG